MTDREEGVRKGLLHGSINEQCLTEFTGTTGSSSRHARIFPMALLEDLTYT